MPMVSDLPQENLKNISSEQLSSYSFDYSSMPIVSNGCSYIVMNILITWAVLLYNFEMSASVHVFLNSCM